MSKAPFSIRQDYLNSRPATLGPWSGFHLWMLVVGCWMLDVQLTSLEHNIREGNSVISGPGDALIYRSRLNASRSFEVFTPTDFLAAITRHIPNKGAQMVRY